MIKRVKRLLFFLYLENGHDFQFDLLLIEELNPIEVGVMLALNLIFIMKILPKI